MSVLLGLWLTLHWGILPRLEGWRPQIEVRASQALGVPLGIGRIEVRTGGWIPVIDLHEVELRGPDGTPALRLPHVRAALSPRSLLGLTPRFAQLFVDGAELDIRRDALGRVRIGGLELAGPSGAPDAGGPATGGGAGPVADWFFRQSEFVVRNGRLRWTDEQRLAPPVELQGVTLVVRNSLRRHDIRLDATPTAEWGERFTLRGRFTQSLLAAPSDWRRWSGTLHADLPRADLQTLRRHVDLPVEVQEGDGALRAWVDVRSAEVQAVTADLALREVSVRLAPGLEPLALRGVTGRIVARRDADRLRLDLQRFAFEADGAGPLDPAPAHWPASDLSLSLQQQQPGGLARRPTAPVTGGEFRAERLDLALLARLAERLPLGGTLHPLLASMAPEGVLTALEARWEGPLDAPARYTVALRGEGLALQAGAVDATAEVPSGAMARPGFRGASIELQATERGGQAQLTLRDGHLHFPGVFDDPVLPMAELQAPLKWTVDPGATAGAPKVQLSTTELRFANADARGSLSATWTTGPGTGFGPEGRYPGRLDLNARILEARAARVSRYLPVGIPAHTRHYLDDAITAGDLSRGNLRARGALWDFPWFGPVAQRPGAAGGEFRVSARIDRARYAFVPSAPARGTQPAWTTPWPALEDLSADLSIEGGALSLTGASARVGALQVLETRARIPDLGHDARVLVQGRAVGPAQDWLAFVGRTPVRDWTQAALDGWRASGDAALALSLDLPLQRLQGARVQGQVELRGNDLQVGHGVPPLAQARGRIDFSENGFRIQQATARAVGGEATVDGGREGDAPLRLRVQGSASAEGLRRSAELGFVARAAQHLGGSTAYQLQFEAGGSGRSLVLQSALTGLSSDLPAPLRKDAAAAMPLRYELTTRTVAAALAAGEAPRPDATTERDQLRVDLGGVVQARYGREWSGERLRAVRGQLTLGEAAVAAGTEPALAVEPAGAAAGGPAGVVARVRLPLADLDAWRPVIDRVFLEAPAAPTGAPAMASGLPQGAAASGATAPPPATSGPDPHAPTELHLQADRLIAFGRPLQAVQASWWPDADGWRADLKAREAEGRLEWREDAGNGRMRARLTRLDLPRPGTAEAGPPTGSGPTGGLGGPVAGPGAPGGLNAVTTALPALDLVVDELSWQGRRIGRFELEAHTRSGPVRTGAREWRVARLALVTPEARLQAQGPWRGPPEGVGAGGALDFQLDIADTGDLLDRVLQQRSIRGGKGVLQGSVQWQGSALWPDFASMGGRLQLALEGGQFLRAEPGAGRLLGVLSLQALPRRLALDFRDVFQEGFAFDSITGDVAIESGMARTRNLSMQGVQATVLMEGQADLLRETQDLRVVVVPEINAGTASLAYAAINPAVGVGTFLAQLFLRRPLAAAGTREFHVSGSWADPQVARVERRAGVPSEGPAERGPESAGLGPLVRPAGPAAPAVVAAPSAGSAPPSAASGPAAPGVSGGPTGPGRPAGAAAVQGPGPGADVPPGSPADLAPRSWPGVPPAAAPGRPLGPPGSFRPALPGHRLPTPPLSEAP